MTVKLDVRGTPPRGTKSYQRGQMQELKEKTLKPSQVSTPELVGSWTEIGLEREWAKDKKGESRTLAVITSQGGSSAVGGWHLH